MQEEVITAGSTLAETVGGKAPTLFLQEILGKGIIKGLPVPVVWRKIKNFLAEKGPDGASTNEISVKLNLMTHHIGYVLKRIEPTGEVFKKGIKWVLTDAVIEKKLSSAPDAMNVMLDRVKDEIEKSLFNNGGLSDEAKAFLEEYASARNLPNPLTPDQARLFARKRVLKNGG